MIDYIKLKETSERLITEYGMNVSFSRNGVKVGSGKGVFIEQDARNETKSRSSLLAQTQLTTKKMIVKAVKNGLQVGDVVTALNADHTITAIREMRPTTVTIYLELEVV